VTTGRRVLPAPHDWLATPDGREFEVFPDVELYGVSCHPKGFLQRRPAAPLSASQTGVSYGVQARRPAGKLAPVSGGNAKGDNSCYDDRVRPSAPTTSPTRRVRWWTLGWTPTTALCRHDTIIGAGPIVRGPTLEASAGWDRPHRWMRGLILWMRVDLTGPALRVGEPLASWDQHSAAATSATGLVRTSEHLRLLEHALSLDRERAERAEQLAEAPPNACIVANSSPATPTSRVESRARRSIRILPLAPGPAARSPRRWASPCVTPSELPPACAGWAFSRSGSPMRARGGSEAPADELQDLVALKLAAPAMRRNVAAAVERKVARRGEDLAQARTRSDIT
jgi:hypothetical protein